MTFDLEMARDLAANPIHCPETDEVFRKAMAEIERLKSELESLNIELMAAGEIVMAKDVQIKELEDALVNERAWRICHIPQDRVGHWPRYEPMLQDEARHQLQAEGKIGPDVMPRSWQITDERKAALLRAYDIVSWIDRVDSDNKLHITAILGMIKEAEAGQ